MEVNHLGRGVKRDGSGLIVSTCARILLVDHNPVALVHNASLLQDQLFDVTTANSAARALKYLESRNGLYHIVMADFHIADMNIYEFIDGIRDQCFRGMPIIMVAEDDPMDLGNEALQKGASYFIRKPLTPMVVSNLLKHIVPKTWGIPDVTSTIPKNKGFTWSYQGNDKQKKIQNTQYGVTSIEAGPSKTRNMRNIEHGNLQSSPNLKKQSCHFTLDGIQEILNGLNSNIALTATTANLTMGTGGVQVARRNGEFQMAGGQMTPSNVYMTGDMAGGINGNTVNLGNISTRSDQVAAGGNQIILEGEQVTLKNCYTSSALQVQNEKASGPSGVKMYCNSNPGYMNIGEGTSSLHSPIEEELTLDDIADILLRYHHLITYQCFTGRREHENQLTRNRKFLTVVPVVIMFLRCCCDRSH
ncbi:hypothetical protein ACET3Z_001832 [Daucus carota]